MNTAAKMILTILTAATLAEPASAQFLGFRRAYYGPSFGPYASPYSSYDSPYQGLYRGSWRAGPLRSVYSIPVVPVQREDPGTLRQTYSSTTSAGDIRVNVDVTGKHAAAITEAIAATKKLLEGGGEAPSPGPGIAAKVNQPLRLPVGPDPKNPLAKEDLSDVLRKDQVVWHYPPKSQFEILHEDTAKAVLILIPKAPGTYTVMAVVVEPLKEAAPVPATLPEEIKIEPKKAETKEEPKEIQPKKMPAKKTPAKKTEEPKVVEVKKAPLPARAFRHIVSFVIRVEGAVPPADGPRPIVGDKKATTAAEARQKIKAAFDREKASPAASAELNNLIGILGRAKRVTEFASALNQSEKTKLIPETMAAIRQYLTFSPSIQTMTAEQIRTPIGEILQSLK
ncbi:MAG: hypothetical protein L0Y71_02770 [Gemmataceae bacterium]|nr:hypothetical protein [Gemmataceae bacterium]